MVETSCSKHTHFAQKHPSRGVFVIDELHGKRYSPPTMKGRTRLLIILLGVAVIGLIAWQSTRNGTDGVAARYPGFVNYEDRNTPEEARAQWLIQEATAEAYLAEHPDDNSTIRTLAQLNHSLGNYAEARRYIERYIEELSISPTGWTILGDIAWDMEDYETAQSSYIKAIELGVNEQLYFKLDRLWREQFPERIPDIEALYEDAITRDAQRPSYLTRLARWYAEHERYGEAALNMEVVVQLLPNDQNAREELAEYRALAQ